MINQSAALQGKIRSQVDKTAEVCMCTVSCVPLEFSTMGGGRGERRGVSQYKGTVCL